MSSLMDRANRPQAEIVLLATLRYLSLWQVVPMVAKALSSMTLPLRFNLMRLGKCLKMGMNSSGLRKVELVRDRDLN